MVLKPRRKVKQREGGSFLLKGLMMAAMVFASFGVVYLIYGKDGLELRQRQGKKLVLPCIGVGALLLLWMLCLILWVTHSAAKDTGLAIAVTFGVPVLILFLTVRTRSRVKKALEEEQQNQDRQA